MKRQTKDCVSKYSNSRRSSVIASVLIILSVGLAGCRKVSQNDADAADLEGGAEKCEGPDCANDAGGQKNTDGGMDADSPPVRGDAGADSADSTINSEDASPDAEGSCSDDGDCDDGLFCNGKERCVFEDDSGTESYCESPGNPCIDPRQCSEEFDRCDCDFDNDGEISVVCRGTDCDDDNDGVAHELCGGNDCDDRNISRFGGNTEICDEKGIDEDCDSSTIANKGRLENGIIVGADGDQDGDGYIDVKCFNIGLDDKRNGGDDCDDTRDDIKPGVTEICDAVDNDCDGLTDENEKGDEYALRATFCRDYDGDGWGNEKQLKRSCNTPEGYVEYDENGEFDCDDRDDARNPDHHEICDGKDNDCDGKTDLPREQGDLLFDQPTFWNTDVECINGEWEITRCPSDKLHCWEFIYGGCETDATALSSCRACETNCSFSCGKLGCDEIDKFSVGGFHVCAVTTEGQAACWGRNGVGQLGIDSRRGSGIPSRVVGIPIVKEIATGYFHTCAIAGEDSRLYCWGSNEHGQLGKGIEIASSSAPLLTLGIGGDTMMVDVKKIAAGSEHTCAIVEEGTVVCWGNEENGRLGNGNYDEESVSTPSRVKDWYYDPVENGAEIVAGFAHTCLLTKEAKVMCWGDNSAGQLGVDGEVIDPGLAQEIIGLSDLLEEGSEIVSLTAGLYHTCALASLGKVYCWGNNGSLQLGRSNDGNLAVPEEVESLSDIVAIAAGNFHTCVVSASNELMCWGGNEYGERGDDSLDPIYQPQSVEYDSFDRVAAGRYVSCGRTTSGQGVCWGNGLYQQLGNDQNPVDFQNIPQKISALEESIP